jgi:hypothetical protein
LTDAEQNFMSAIKVINGPLAISAKGVFMTHLRHALKIIAVQNER